ncbi:DUF2487 family protein [Aneurinibacillus terranovensis]|uniref:DUF2487 family protein n=1 Tax=Aneurinibacillus terranovensis TaxID=278991 RepID=UPI0004224ADB|nr:DUF2487 family protein [Aneurinibacillus terranovensis]
MRWKVEDMKKILDMQDYIDTVIYPVCVSHVPWDKKSIAEPFWVEKVSAAAEQQLTGRVLLFQTLSAVWHDQYIDTTFPYVMQNLEALRGGFPYCLVVTNAEELAAKLREANVEAYVVRAVPEAAVQSKNFLEKSLVEGNRIVQKIISVWN